MTFQKLLLSGLDKQVSAASAQGLCEFYQKPQGVKFVGEVDSALGMHLLCFTTCNVSVSRDFSFCQIITKYRENLACRIFNSYGYNCFVFLRIK